MSSTRPVPATTSSWEFEQQRDVARVLAKARDDTDRFHGRPIVVLGELDWIERVDNAGLGFRTIRPPAAEDFDDFDDFGAAFYGPDGGFWK